MSEIKTSDLYSDPRETFSDSTIVLQAKNLSYAYPCSDPHGEALQVLSRVNFVVHSRQKIALLGASGVGKSTFLHLLGLLDTPDSGEILVKDAGQLISTRDMADHQRTALRASVFGFVYQFHHLLSEFTALENVMIPQLIVGVPYGQAHQKAVALLGRMGLEDRLHHKPSQMSGGQQQRTAIARALANSPSILLADEPTGNLDEETASVIFKLFLELSQEQGLSIVMATHNRNLYQHFDCVYTLKKSSLEPFGKESLEKDFPQRV